MSPENNPQASCHTVAVSSPGSGMARQIVVQYQPSNHAPWQRYASCRTPQQAEACLSHLSRKGFPTRLIRYGSSPTAS